MGFGENSAGTLRFRSGLADAGEEGPEVKAFRLDEVRSGRDIAPVEDTDSGSIGVDEARPGFRDAAGRSLVIPKKSLIFGCTRGK